MDKKRKRRKPTGTRLRWLMGDALGVAMVTACTAIALCAVASLIGHELLTACFAVVLLMLAVMSASVYADIMKELDGEDEEGGEG